MRGGTKMEAINAIAVCSPDGLPMVVIAGKEEEKAKEYIDKETSFVKEQLQFIRVKVVI